MVVHRISMTRWMTSRRATPLPASVVKATGPRPQLENEDKCDGLNKEGKMVDSDKRLEEHRRWFSQKCRSRDACVVLCEDIYGAWRGILAVSIYQSSQTIVRMHVYAALFSLMKLYNSRIGDIPILVRGAEYS
jgi:hypothetical protein